MYGAIIGDTVGSVYEFNNVKSKVFPLFTPESIYTDDSIMTVAVAQALVTAYREHRSFHQILEETMRQYGRQYPHPMGGYGGRFGMWLRRDMEGPYQSYGNGAAMRVSPCGLMAVTMEDALLLAKASAEVTHDHPEGIKGAQAVAAAIFLAKTGKSKKEIQEFIENRFYKLNFTLEQIRPGYRFDETCQGTVPQAIVAFLESENFEDAIRNAVSLGGDSDTLAAITGSIAWSYYVVNDRQGSTFPYGPDGCGLMICRSMEEMRRKTRQRLPEEMAAFVDWFTEFCYDCWGSHHSNGIVQDIPL